MDMMVFACVVEHNCSVPLPALLIAPEHLLLFQLALSLLDRLDHIAASGCIERTWHGRDHLMCNGLCHVAAKFTVFSLVFLHETCTDRLLNVLAAKFADLVDNIEQDFFGAFGPAEAVHCWVADVAVGDIGDTICREGNAVGHLTTPT